jgi:hypothetical protein
MPELSGTFMSPMVLSVSSACGLITLPKGSVMWRIE